MKIAAHFISSLPIVVYFTVTAVEFYIELFEAIKIYVAHSSFCVYEPDVDRVYNNQFGCKRGGAFVSDTRHGISKIPLSPSYNITSMAHK